MPIKNKIQPIANIPAQPNLRIVVTHINFKIYRACIYFSSYDQTAEILLILKSKTGDSTGRFLKKPIYFLSARSKTNIDLKISKLISSRFNLKISSGSVPVPVGANNYYKLSA